MGMSVREQSWRGQSSGLGSTEFSGASGCAKDAVGRWGSWRLKKRGRPRNLV